MDLPDDAILLIDNFARMGGGKTDDLWMHLTIYEHRLRNQRVIMHVILSQVRCAELEYITALNHLKRMPGISVFARQEPAGNYTIQLMSVGFTTHNSLFRSDHRFLYSVIEDGQIVVVDEIHNALIGRFFNGAYVTLLSTPQAYRKSTFSTPAVRVCEMKIAERQMTGTSLLGTCKRMKTLCERFWVWKPS